MKILVTKNKRLLKKLFYNFYHNKYYAINMEAKKPEVAGIFQTRKEAVQFYNYYKLITNMKKPDQIYFQCIGVIDNNTFQLGYTANPKKAVIEFIKNGWKPEQLHFIIKIKKQ